MDELVVVAAVTSGFDWPTAREIAMVVETASFENSTYHRLLNFENWTITLLGTADSDFQAEAEAYYRLSSASKEAFQGAGNSWSLDLVLHLVPATTLSCL